jgi:hypothetical protein
MSPLVIVLLVIVGLIALGIVATVGAGLFVVHKVKQAGLDPALMQKNPSLAVAKMLTALNPDVEVMNYDEGSGKITIREKSTGKTVTMDFEDAKKGRISFSESGGKGGSVEFGAGGKLPAWVPSYPGAKGEGNFAAKSEDGEGGVYTMTTKDSVSQVIEFYKTALKGAGMKIVTTAEDSGAQGSGMIMAEDEASKHTLMVVIGSGSEGTTVSLTYGTKK